MVFSLKHEERPTHHTGWVRLIESTNRSMMGKKLSWSGSGKLLPSNFDKMDGGKLWFSDDEIHRKWWDIACPKKILCFVEPWSAQKRRSWPEQGIKSILETSRPNLFQCLTNALLFTWGSNLWSVVHQSISGDYVGLHRKACETQWVRSTEIKRKVTHCP